MKRLLILVCVLALLLSLAGVASASPEPPKKFRIKGDTTLIDFQGFPFVFLRSEGKAIQNIKGTFNMDETLIPLGPPFTNSGTLTITTKKDGMVSIFFMGSSNYETVWGTFQVTGGTGYYATLVGAAGDYEGIADVCDLPCNPWSNPPCFVIEEPDCDGFYVDFTFNSYGY
ncbi:MAG: hypothetical protein FJZ89_05520 [Chloroflexi bacterium]|nr:hypothetical protein [Chloroflexota bacterium]